MKPSEYRELVRYYLTNPEYKKDLPEILREEQSNLHNQLISHA